MKEQKIPTGRETVDVDDEDLFEDDEDLNRVPRSGKRKLMPIERLWPCARRDS